MQTFEQIWETSRTNSWSYLYPTVLWAGVGALIVVSLIRWPLPRRTAKMLLIIGLTIAAIWSAGREIQEKWKIRGDWANLHEDQMTDAQQYALTVDGTNLTLGPLIYGFGAFMLFVATCTVLSLVRFILVRYRKSKVDHSLPTGKAT